MVCSNMEKIITHSAAETEAFADRFAHSLKPNDIVAFKGSMGMGKTAFTRGLLHGLGGDDIVSSPTFALVNEYQSSLCPVYHFDMYRVTTWNDLYSTGFFDYLDSGSILVIEWSENIEGALPDSTITVDISLGDTENDRIIQIINGKQ